MPTLTNLFSQPMSRPACLVCILWGSSFLSHGDHSAKSQAQ